MLNGLNPETMDWLATRAQRTEPPAGTVVVREGENGNRLYLIDSGLARVVKNLGRDHEVELAMLKPGDFFGEGCILTTLPRTASVQTTCASVLFSLSSLDFYHLYQAMPAQYAILLLNMARDLSRRLRVLDEKFAACH